MNKSSIFKMWYDTINDVEIADLSVLDDVISVLSEHLEPETVSFHCHSPQLTVLFVAHSSFTSTDIILIGIAKLSQMRWVVC